MSGRYFTDQPSTDDQLNFHRYVNEFINILEAIGGESFTLGIFGEWGAGKTTLIHFLEKKLEGDYSSEYKVIHFNPWRYRNDSDLLVPFVQELRLQTASEFKESAAKIGETLSRIGVDLVLRGMTVNTVSVEKLEKVEDTIADRNEKTVSATIRLNEALKSMVSKSNRKFVVFIDDLDRCSPEKIVDLLEDIKILLAVPKVIFVLAVDPAVIEKAIEMKYSKHFSELKAAGIARNFLNKLIQIPFHLLPLSVEQVEKFVHMVDGDGALSDFSKLLSTLVPRNPRQVKLVLNLLFSRISIASENGLEFNSGQRNALVRLAVMQVLFPTVHQQVLSGHKFLRILELCATNGIVDVQREIEELPEFQSKLIFGICNGDSKEDFLVRRILKGNCFSSLGDEDLSMVIHLDMSFDNA